MLQMGPELIKLLQPGMGAAWQGGPAQRWRRFGVPTGGPMDDHAAAWANRLVGNASGGPVLELLWGGAKVEILADCSIAITGAPAKTALPLWRSMEVKGGQVIDFAPGLAGIWIYVAVGISSPRSAPENEMRGYTSPPPMRVWKGPQWQMFSEAFFQQEWTMTPQSNRVGYRLTGQPLSFAYKDILSEPVRVGTIQVPENGLPIVTMRDGPTVGGYPKLGMVDPADLSWLAQCRPGQKIRFVPVE